MANPIRVRLKVGSRHLVWPLNPSEITRSGAPRVSTFETLSDTHEFVTGPGVQSFSWSGIFPGKRRADAPYLVPGRWEDPRDLCETLHRWMENGRKAILIISWWGVREPVYISSFEDGLIGGNGDVPYSIEVRSYRELDVQRKKKKKKKRRKHRGRDRDRDGGGGGREGNRRTYTVKKGDTLGKIARRLLGSATRWRDIYEIPKNRKTIGKDPDKIEPGMELIIPARKD